MSIHYTSTAHGLINSGLFTVSVSQENEDPNIKLTFHKLFTLTFELFFVRKSTTLKIYFQKTSLAANLIKLLVKPDTQKKQ